MNMEHASVSKISPLILGKVVPRERLFTLLDQKTPTNAFWVSGPGGSGKTTFVASYLQERKKPCLWYQVDALDGDLATFFYYLGQAATSLMDSTNPPLPLLTPEYLPNLETFVLRYFEMLYRQIQPGAWLIFDNFQDAPIESSLLPIFSTAIKRLPGHLALVIISRNSPPHDVSRLIANRRMKSISRNQITFTPEEFSGFLSLTECRIDKTQAKRLYQMTKGWIAGAILWLQHNDDYIADDIFAIDQTPEYIFDYFAAEILDKNADTTRSFLWT